MRTILRQLSAPAPREALASRRSFLQACAVGLAGTLFASSGFPQEEKAVTSREAREDAQHAIPWEKLNDETQRKIRSVMEHPSIYRRMPRRVVECDSDLYVFLLRNPEVVVNMWQVMGVSNMTAQRTGDYTWKGNDGSGTLCDVELAYGTEDTHILYGEGFYEGPLFKRRIAGRCVVLLRSAYDKPEGERQRVANLLDVFLTVDNAGLDLIAKTLSPLVGSTADTNFAETAKFLSRVSLTAEQNGAGLQRMATKLTQVEPTVRDKFIELTATVQERAALRNAAAPAAATTSLRR
jgi:hypothetical protein